MSGEHDDQRRKHSGDGKSTRQKESKRSKEEPGSRSKNVAKSKSSKSTPSWLASSSETADARIAFDLADPEDLLRKMESVELTDEETEELLKRAYEINQQLRQAAEEVPSHTRTCGGSAPPAPSTGNRLSSSDRPRSRGMMEGDLLPQLPRGRHQTSLSSGLYGRTSSALPASSDGSAARYTSYHSAQVVYELTPLDPPAKSKLHTQRRPMLE